MLIERVLSELRVSSALAVYLSSKNMIYYDDCERDQFELRMSYALAVYAVKESNDYLSSVNICRQWSL